MAHISGTRIFPSMGFVQEYSKYSLYKFIHINFPINSKNPVFGSFLAHFPHFWAKKIFMENPALSHITSYGFLAPCQNLEKVNDTTQRKRLDRRKDGRREGRTDLILKDPSSYCRGSN